MENRRFSGLGKLRLIRQVREAVVTLNSASLLLSNRDNNMFTVCVCVCLCVCVCVCVCAPASVLKHSILTVGFGPVGIEPSTLVQGPGLVEMDSVYMCCRVCFVNKWTVKMQGRSKILGRHQWRKSQKPGRRERDSGEKGEGGEWRER